jgi:hypothetical protein
MFSNFNGSINPLEYEANNTIINNSLNDIVASRTSSISIYIQTTLIDKLFNPFIVGNYEEVQDNFKIYYDEIIQYLYKNIDVPLVRELLKSIAVLERSILLIKELEVKDSQIKGLQNKINNMCKKDTGAAIQIETNVEVDAVLDYTYILYIREFGPPDNGIFDPIKLASLRTG